MMNKIINNIKNKIDNNNLIITSWTVPSSLFEEKRLFCLDDIFDNDELIKEIKDAVDIASINGSFCINHENLIVHFSNVNIRERFVDILNEKSNHFFYYVNNLKMEKVKLIFRDEFSSETNIHYIRKTLFCEYNKRFVLNNDDPIEQLSSAIIEGKTVACLYFDYPKNFKWDTKFLTIDINKNYGGQL